MAESEDLEITLDEPSECIDNRYTSIINSQIDFLYYLREIDYSELYDKSTEDKITCIELCYKVIAAAQKALLKEIEEA